MASGKERERERERQEERGRQKDTKNEREGDRKRETERVVGTHHSIAGKVDGTTVRVRCQRPRNACLRWRKPRWELAGEVVEWSRGCAARSAVLQLELSTA